MIDSKFIIQYTDALYASTPDIAPLYNEFRDMFSSGQIKSKEWVIKELKNINISNHTIAIAGAWYGTLGVLLKSEFPNCAITMIDIDPRCEQFVKNIISSDTSMRYVTANMYDYAYYQNIVINTSCEHISDLKAWLKTVPEDTTVILQSNNYIDGNGHISCVSSKEEFIAQSGLTNIRYIGELTMPMYTRYMIIGTVNNEST